MSLNSSPVKNFLDFGYANNLNFDLNSEFLIDNFGGYSTIIFQLTVPTGGEVIFEGIFNGSWTPVTMRGITTDGYLQTSSSSQSFIGSITGLRQFRIRVIKSGTSQGSVKGRIQRDSAIIEGIEHGSPPHKFGYRPISKAATFSAQQTNTAIWTPPADRKFVVTDLIIIGSGNTSANLTIFDEVNTMGNRLFRGFVSVGGNAGQFRFNTNLRTPFISNTKGNSLRVTTDAGLNVDIMIFGYEAEN